MRHVAALLGVIVVGLPFVITPSSIIIAAGAVAALLIAAGIIRLSPSLVSAGITASLAQYTLALWLDAGPGDPLIAVVLGAVMVVLIQVVDFARRFRGAEVAPAVTRTQIRYWLRNAILGVVLGLVVAGLASGFTLALPSAAYPVLAAVGLVVTLLALTRLISRQDIE
jgi:hypothetical protein